MNKFKIVSDSMMPLIPVGAEIFIEDISLDSNLKRFDILLFKIDEKLFCHYFWHQNTKIEPGFVTTRALKDNSKDAPFKRELILGRVINFKISLYLKFKIFLWDLIN